MPTSRGRHPYRPIASGVTSPTSVAGPTISVQPASQRVRSTGVGVLSLGPAFSSLNSLPIVGLARRKKVWTFAALGGLLVFLIAVARSHPQAAFSRHYGLHRPNDYDEPQATGEPIELSYDTSNPFLTRYSLPTTGKLAGRANEPLMEQLMLKLRGKEALVKDAYLQSLETEAGREKGSAKAHPHGRKTEDFRWLQDRTILLLGDSIDRYHLLHLCQFLQPAAPLRPLPWPDAQPRDYVSVYTPTSDGTPYPSRIADLEAELAELHRGGNPYGSEPSRVWSCAIDKRQGGLNALLVWGFLNGMDDGVTTPGVVPYPPSDADTAASAGKKLIGEPTYPEAAPMPFGDRAFWPVESPHFNPPLSSEDRYQQLFGPILKSLGREKVDMVELGVGPWDLGMFKSQDTLSVKRSTLTQNTNETYVDSLASALSAEPLSSARLAWFSGRLRALHDFLTARYPGRLRVRGMHLTPQWYNYHWVFEQVRIRQIQRAAVDVVGEDPLQGGLSGWESVIEPKGEWLDHIHPGPIPGSWIWADMALNDLKRLVTSKRN